MTAHPAPANGPVHPPCAHTDTVSGTARALPRVTVAVMSYNNARFIEATIRSVLDQKGIELDVVVFDDGSTDDSVALLEAFRSDARFTLHLNPTNLGMTGNYNRCVDAGRGEFVVVLGSDDVLYPGHLATLANALDALPQAPLAYTQCRWIDEADRAIESPVHPGHLGRSYHGGRDEVVDLLRFDNYITPSAVMLRRACYDAFRLPGGEIHRLDLLAGDWELWTRIARVLPDFVYLQQATIGYRVHGSQISAGFYRSERPLAEHTEILELNLADAAVLSRAQIAGADIWALYQRRLAGYPPETRARFDARAERIRQKLFSLPPMDPGGPFFTVVLTTFNRPQLLVDALASLVHQTFRDFEVVLVNDHGEPVETVMHSVDLPITYIYQGTNRGLSAARNAALRLARGRYVVYLDDDDIYTPRHLEVLAAAHQRHPDAVVYTGVTYVQERLDNGKREELGRHEPFTHSVFSRERLFVQNYIPVNTWSHPRSAVDAATGFDTSLTALEDWDMLLRLAATRSFVHVQDSTAEVHIRTSSTQADDHMLAREGKNFPALYRRLYDRHGHLGDATVRAEQEAFLARLARQEPVELTASQRLLRWQDARVPLQSEGRLIDAHLQAAGGGPRFLVLVRDIAGDDEKLAATLGSLQFGRHLYERVSVVVLTSDARAAGAATVPTDRIHLVGAGPDGIDAANEMVVRSDADWHMVVDSGVEFSRSGLLMVALEVLQAPDCRALYCDELRRLPDGTVGAAFRPGVNLDYLLSFPVSMAGHWLVRKDAFVQAGGFDPAHEDAAGFDLLLRLVDQGGLDGLRHLAEPLLTTDTPDIARAAGLGDSVRRHLLRRGYPDAEVSEPLPGRYRIRYGHSARPRVSIVARCLGGVTLLQRCIESVLEKTAYGEYEILIADATVSPDTATQAWLSGIEAMGSPDLRVVRCGGNSAAEAANRAAQAARGDYLCFLDDACAVIQADWLDGLLNHALRPEVGAVGAKLLRADGTVRSALCVLGLDGPVGSAFVGAKLDDGGYMHRLEVDQNASVVDGACMVVRAEVFHAVGGFSAAAEGGGYGATDLCLSIGASGYLVVWTPHVVMLCDGGAAEAPRASADVDAEDSAAEALYAKWLPRLARDPAYNPNLSLRGGGFSLEPNAALNWDPLPWRPLPVVLALPADHGGCGHYRIIKPFQAMKAGGVVDGMLSADFFSPIELERYGADAIVFQRQLTDPQLDNMQRVRQFNRIFKIYELDDYLPNLPVKSVHKRDIGQDVIKTLRRGLGYVDRFVVSTDTLAESFAGLHADIRVVRNRLPPEWWAGLSSQRGRGRLPRVGWAGGAGHTGDLELVADVVKALASEVEWVFMGLCPDKLRPYVHEVRPGVPIDAYPRALAALDLDVAIAPLEQNLFNACKSNLRLLEYGACGFPVVCSDIVCYRGDLPVTRVKNRFKDWVDAIRMHTADLAAAAQAGDALRAQVHRDWMLDGPHLVDWRDAWTGR
ncbi:glycosyltransferase [Sphingomonas sp. NCPPB 2930]